MTSSSSSLSAAAPSCRAPPARFAVAMPVAAALYVSVAAALYGASPEGLGGLLASLWETLRLFATAAGPVSLVLAFTGSSTPSRRLALASLGLAAGAALELAP